MNFIKFFIIIFIMLLAPMEANTSAYNDTQIKAAYLINLIKFIDWPNNTSINDNIRICIIGDNLFKTIETDFEKSNISGKNIILINQKQDSQLHSCSIVYISESEKSGFDSLLNSLQHYPVLTISDINKFAQNGGMIGFINYNGTIRLEINAKKLSESNFTIDKQLLDIALNVY